MKTSQATATVFISHSHQDNELVRDLAVPVARGGS